MSYLQFRRNIFFGRNKFNARRSPMDDPDMWGSAPASMYGLPPPFIPGADTWGAPPLQGQPQPNATSNEGWGGPMYGGPPPMMQQQQQQQQQLQEYQMYNQGIWNPGPASGPFSPGNMFDVPPPNHLAMQFPGARGRGRGGPRGGPRGGATSNSNPVFNHFDLNLNSSRGARGGRGSRGMAAGPPVLQGDLLRVRK